MRWLKGRRGTQESVRHFWYAAIAVYCLWAGLLIWENPGFQYDEALLVLGGVHMLNSPGELTLPHDPDTWLCAPGRCFPLMTVRYVGAVKEYLTLPLFAIFGPHAEIVRMVGMFLGALGIFGVAKLIADQVSQSAAAVTALLIAMNPSYVDMTVFDNGTVAVVMAALGLLCLAINEYLRTRSARAALWVGAAMGFGVWARTNFVWVIVAAFGAAVVVLRTRLLRVPLSHVGTALAGGVLAGSPFLAYQVHSKGGTFEALNMFVSNDTLGQRLWTRLVLLSDTLLSNTEHRVIWSGAPIADWQRWLLAAIVCAACIVALWIGSLWARIAALTFLILSAFLFFSRLQVAEHHLIVLVPIAAVMCTLAFRRSSAVVAVVAFAYLGAALYWQIAAVRGLARTGGVGVWSDAIYSLADHLQEHYRNRQIKILDWGLQNNLYVLTGGKLHTLEIYGDASQHRPWSEEIREGGVFLLNGPDNRQFPDASIGFLRALEDSHASAQRFAAMQRNGTEYAEIVDVQSGTRPTPRFTGVYQIEENGWRWTRREFSITLDALGQSGARLAVQLYIPESLIQKLGHMTLSARLGGHILPPETYGSSGEHTFECDLQAGWLSPGPNKFEFTLDKSLPASSSDPRELGIIVVRASLDPTR